MRCADDVLPALLPGEGCVDEILERRSLEEMAQREALRRVGDQEDTATVEFAYDVGEEAAQLLHAVAVALAAGEGPVDEAAARVERGGRGAVQLSVVALAQSLVLPELDAAAGKRDLRRLDCAPQAGREDARDPVVAAPLPECACEAPTPIGELPGQPAGRDTRSLSTEIECVS